MTNGDPPTKLAPAVNPGPYDAVAVASCTKHRPDRYAGCSCGFSLWTPEHVAVMAVRDVRLSYQATGERNSVSALVWDEVVSLAHSLTYIDAKQRDELVKRNRYRK